MLGYVWPGQMCKAPAMGKAALPSAARHNGLSWTGLLVSQACHAATAGTHTDMKHTALP